MRLALALAVIALPAVPALAQAPAPRDEAGGRFVLREAPQGLLRMDTRTGTMSICADASGTFTCRLVPDDRAALEHEIERLKAENEALKRAGPAQPARPGRPPAEGLNLPSDAEVDRALSLAQRIWRALREMIRESEGNPLPERRL